MEAAFSNALLETLVGSITPAFNKDSYLSVLALYPKSPFPSFTFCTTSKIFSFDTKILSTPDLTGKWKFPIEYFCKRFEIPIIKKIFLETKNPTKLVEATSTFLKNYHKYILVEDAKLFDISAPKLVLGDIASGDQFISSLKKITKLNKQIPSAICVEMEGAAVAQICYEYKMPFSIIRIISDKANDNATIDFSKFSNSIASNYALGILENYFT